MALKVIDPTVFDALGYYINTHQRLVLGEISSGTVYAVMWQMVTLHRQAVMDEYPNQPDLYLDLLNYEYSERRVVFKEMVHEIPHYNREQATEALKLINEYCGTVKTARDAQFFDTLITNLEGVTQYEQTGLA